MVCSTSVVWDAAAAHIGADLCTPRYLDGEVVGVDTDGGEPATVTSVQMAVGSDKTEVERLPCGAVVNATGPWCTLLANAAGVTDLPVAPRTRTIFSFHCKDAEAWSDDVGLVCGGCITD